MTIIEPITCIEYFAADCRDALRPLGLKGKALNQTCVVYWAGIERGLRRTNHPNADWVNRVVWLLISTRGWPENERLAAQYDRKLQLVQRYAA